MIVLIEFHSKYSCQFDDFRLHWMFDESLAINHWSQCIVDYCIVRLW